MTSGVDVTTEIVNNIPLISEFSHWNISNCIMPNEKFLGFWNIIKSAIF